MTALLHRSTRWLLVLLMANGLGACALLQPRDPLNISVIGIEPLPGQELEMRMAVKMRVQNPSQAYGLGQVNSLQGLPYKLRGKLAGGPLGTVRFTDEGKLDLPKGTY